MIVFRGNPIVGEVIRFGFALRSGSGMLMVTRLLRCIVAVSRPRPVGIPAGFDGVRPGMRSVKVGGRQEPTADHVSNQCQMGGEANQRSNPRFKSQTSCDGTCEHPQWFGA